MLCPIDLASSMNKHYAEKYWFLKCFNLACSMIACVYTCIMKLLTMSPVAAYSGNGACSKLSSI
jgi:hypothetical protein